MLAGVATLVLVITIGVTAIDVMSGARHAPIAVLVSLLPSPTATATSASPEAAMPALSPTRTPIIPTYTLGPLATVPPTFTPSVTPVLVSTAMPSSVAAPTETPALRLVTAAAGRPGPMADAPVPLAAAPSLDGSAEKWIDVDLTNQSLRAN